MKNPLSFAFVSILFCSVAMASNLQDLKSTSTRLLAECSAQKEKELCYQDGIGKSNPNNILNLLYKYSANSEGIAGLQKIPILGQVFEKILKLNETHTQSDLQLSASVANILIQIYSKNFVFGSHNTKDYDKLFFNFLFTNADSKQKNLLEKLYMCEGFNYRKDSSCSQKLLQFISKYDVPMQELNHPQSRLYHIGAAIGTCSRSVYSPTRYFSEVVTTVQPIYYSEMCYNDARALLTRSDMALINARCRDDSLFNSEACLDRAFKDLLNYREKHLITDLQAGGETAVAERDLTEWCRDRKVPKEVNIWNGGDTVVLSYCEKYVILDSSEETKRKYARCLPLIGLGKDLRACIDTTKKVAAPTTATQSAP